ncbi:MAG: helix-hairpin-helix domain-containing protein [Bacillus sp. (in: Bacteria)]|nr:helix-hairpin-helix domain-containing protein [Bacillus sp. (in: firmicutes)]MCM1426896.1 helix-hairpin-helix domain-containing protein [Eubacterium sp.]
MRILIKNLLKRGIFLLFFLPIFVLTACTSKNEIVWESDAQETENAVETGFDIQKTAAAPDAEVAPGTEAVPEKIYVHICGAVEKPGVYTLAAGSRIFEGVEAAGGFTQDACEDFINLAQILQDGQRIAIPTLEEVENAMADASYQEQWMSEESQAQSADGRVNINTAGEAELSAISGIGEGKAAAIVQYRQENGKFSCIEDIMKVNGIKEGTYEKIKDKITVK